MPLKQDSRLLAELSSVPELIGPAVLRTGARRVRGGRGDHELDAPGDPDFLSRLAAGNEVRRVHNSVKDGGFTVAID